jgi:proteic killer suppression protein
MEAEFEDRDLEKVEADKAKSIGLGPGVDKTFRKRMQIIRAANDERDFYALKGLHFEKLKDNKANERSMRLNDQWRLIVRLEGEAPNKKVVIVGVKDYH